MKTFLVILMLLLLAVLFMATMVRSEDALASNALHSEQTPYSRRGPHPVGARGLVIEENTPLKITIWYPASQSGNRPSTISYPYEIKMFASWGTVSIATFEGAAMPDAPYALSAEPYPLVILSPGFALGGKTYGWLAEHIASYGFVVIAPEHDEQLDLSLLWRSTITRPQDIQRVLSFVDKQVGVGGLFEELIDVDQMAVIGHSYGGYTALATGGARLNTADFEASCHTAYQSNDPIVFLCDALLPHLDEMAALADLEAVPEGLWPDWGDERVRAIISLAGDAAVFEQAGLAQITVPVMAIGGTADNDSPYLSSTHPTYEFTSSSKKVRLGMLDAAHMIFTGRCETVRRFMQVMPNYFCSDPAWDKNEAHDLIKQVTTAFLLAELKQSTEAAAMLAPDRVHFSKVIYEAEGY